ncbi:MAG: HlyC/CorC family transporter [Ignavibacteriales bacterium]|nr:HlyC/CorC family transporter [Ignavibacteriales bacterium]MCB9209834.1 HlyC/CorC family transporter [Ignavibacteriales bacterium]
MDVDWFYRGVALLILLLFSAIFSGSEVALFSLDDKKLGEVKRNSGVIGNYITKLLLFPRKLLVTILIGNTVVNVAASIISVSIALDVAAYYKTSVDITLLVQIIILTIIIILFAEITPKVWANKHPIYFSRIVAIPLFWISKLLSPLSMALSGLIKAATSKVKYDKARTALSTSEITELADIGVEKGTLEEEEHGLIHGLVAFKSVYVREVMTPRVDMISVPIEISLKELINLIKESGHSRIPVYKDDLDNILGILYAKDLLPYLNDELSINEFNLQKIVRECLFVPETKLISILMAEFQAKNMHMSIVVDEYGGTSGLITLEDILEEIVGEIRDEFDDEEDEITEIEENKFIVSGKTDIDEIEDKLKISIEDPDEDFETIGGFILNQAGTIPEVGYSFEQYGYKFTVSEVENNRINKVEIEKKIVSEK